MKRLLFILLCVALIMVGGISAYLYFDSEAADYSNGVFVDRGEANGYATMYDLFKSL